MFSFIKVLVVCLCQLSVLAMTDNTISSSTDMVTTSDTPDGILTSEEYHPISSTAGIVLILQDVETRTALQDSQTSSSTGATPEATKIVEPSTPDTTIAILAAASSSTSSSSKSWNIEFKPPRSTLPLQTITTTSTILQGQADVDIPEHKPTDSFLPTFKLPWGPSNLPKVVILTKVRMNWLWDPDEEDTAAASPAGDNDQGGVVNNIMAAGITIAPFIETLEDRQPTTENRVLRQTAVPQVDVVNVNNEPMQSSAPEPRRRQPITRTMTRVFQETRVIIRSIPQRPREPIQSVVVFTSTMPPITRVSMSVIPSRITSHTIFVGASRTRVIPTVVPAHVTSTISVSGGVTHTSLLTKEASTALFVTTALDGREITSVTVVPPSVSTEISVEGGVTRTFATTVSPNTSYMTTIDGQSTIIQTFTESAKTMSFTTVESGSTVLISSTVQVEQTGFVEGGFTVITEVRDMTRTYETVLPGETGGSRSGSSLGEAESGGNIINSSVSAILLYLVISFVVLL